MIEAKDLRFTYPGGDREALGGINFRVEKGEVFGFLGPSGAGKSTLQKVLIGFETGYTGSARVDGLEVKERTPDYYNRIGVQFELPGFYGRFTAMENLKLFSSLHDGKKENPMDLLSRLGLEKDGNRKVQEYSKGMRIRLDLARSLLHSPAILFLDEPTAGLDPLNIELVLNEIKRRSERKTTILIATHDMEVARRICHRVAFISQGNIAALDTPRNLMLGRAGGKFRVEFIKNGETHSAVFPMDRPGQSEEFLKLCREETFETIHSLEPGLGEVFVEITGRSLV